MRKIAILLIVLTFSAFAWSQTLDVHGTYKGQTLKAKGRYRPDGTVEITSFSYAPYDKLDGEVKTLRSQKKTLEEEKSRLEKRVRTLESSGGGGKASELREEISLLNNRIDSLTAVINNRGKEMQGSKTEVAQLRKQIQDSAAAHSAVLGRYKTELKSKDQKIAELELKVRGKGLNTNPIALEMSYGSSVIKNDLTNQDFWKRSFSPSLQVLASYTYYFSDKSPFAIKTGIGFASYNGDLSAERLFDTVGNLVDDDGDSYEARYSYNDISESVSMKYIEIPILLHVGNSFLTNGVQAWIEAGLKVGFNVGNSFEGNGTFSCEGYYPQWNVSIQDVEALGFVSDAQLYSSNTVVEPNKFALWGILSAGMNIPLNDKIAILVGAQCAYTLIPVNSGDATKSHYLLGKANSVMGESTRIFNLGAKFGLTINL